MARREKAYPTRTRKEQKEEGRVSRGLEFRSHPDELERRALSGARQDTTRMIRVALIVLVRFFPFFVSVKVTCLKYYFRMANMQWTR